MRSLALLVLFTAVATGAESDVPPGMVVIPAGRAVIGLERVDVERLDVDGEKALAVLAASVPRHFVDVSPFLLDRTEVTQAQWETYLAATARAPSAELKELVWKGDAAPAELRCHPITCITLPEAKAFARWAGKRLPTEVEWEAAARGTDGRLYPWGDAFDDPPLDPTALTASQPLIVRGAERARCGGTDPRRFGTDPVGSHPAGASPFGALDLAGNVWEWTSSRLVPYPDSAPLTLNRGRRARGGGEERFVADFNRDQFVVRGGSFFGDRIELLAALRQGAGPGTALTSVGFRCARDPRPGADAVAGALQDVGQSALGESRLDLDQSVAVEALSIDADGLVTAAARHVAFAPIAGWTDAVRSLKSVAAKQAVPIGVLSTTEPLLDPRLPAGSFVVALRGAERGKRPARGGANTWTQRDDGSDQLVLISAQGQMLAARTIPAVKADRAVDPTRLDRELLVDPKIAGANQERLRFRFAVPSGRDAFAFELPLVVAAGALAR